MSPHMRKSYTKLADFFKSPQHLIIRFQPMLQRKILLVDMRLTRALQQKRKNASQASWFPTRGTYSHGGDVLSGKCIGRVTDQQAGFTNSSERREKGFLVNLNTILACTILLQ